MATLSTNNEDDLTVALIALGAVGLGIGAFVALTSWEKRRKFKDALEAALEDEGILFISAETGISTEGLTWLVTIAQPEKGSRVLRADFPFGTDLYAPQTLNDLLKRLIAALRPA